MEQLRHQQIVYLEAILTIALYRHTCPDAESLVDFCYDDVAVSERQVIAAHLEQCPHCAREIAMLHREQTDVLCLTARCIGRVWQRSVITPGSRVLVISGISL